MSEPMDLHPYDGVERRFRHTDRPTGDGVQVVGQILGLSAHLIPAGVCFDLSFYSGGIGVLDRLAITLPADKELQEVVFSALKVEALELAEANPERLTELRWLFGGVDEAVEPPPLRELAIAFINEGRREFQTLCDQTHQIVVGLKSDVNSWAVLWADQATLNYLGYDQG